MKKIKGFLKGVWICITVIMWLILFPFVFFFDRFFGGWKK